MAAWANLLIQGPNLGPRDPSMYIWRSRVRHHISSLSVICRTPYTPWIFTAGHQPTRILRGTPRPRICRKSAICRFPFPSLCSFFVLLRCCHVLSLQGSPALESLIYLYIHLGSARDNLYCHIDCFRSHSNALIGGVQRLRRGKNRKTQAGGQLLLA
jgi:hypothetical protein